MTEILLNFSCVLHFITLIVIVIVFFLFLDYTLCLVLHKNINVWDLLMISWMLLVKWTLIV